MYQTCPKPNYIAPILKLNGGCEHKIPKKADRWVDWKNQTAGVVVNHEWYIISLQISRRRSQYQHHSRVQGALCARPQCLEGPPNDTNQGDEKTSEKESLIGVEQKMIFFIS